MSDIHHIFGIVVRDEFPNLKNDRTTICGIGLFEDDHIIDYGELIIRLYISSRNRKDLRALETQYIDTN
jgi:hypothetical protein